MNHIRIFIRMFNLHIITLGKLKKSYWKEAETEYLKRLRAYAKLRVTNLQEESFRSLGEKNAVLKKEAEKVLKKISPDAFVIVMTEHGKTFDSIQFAKWLEQQSTQGQEIVLVFGGPLGLDQSLLDRANLKVSLSSLTFPHQMAYVVLLEQLYRAGTIEAGKQYHY